MDSTIQTAFPTDLLIDTPDGPVPLTPERAAIPLPRGLEDDGPQLAYGPYLTALARFLLADSATPLVTALSLHLRRPIAAESIRRLSIISEKHGAFYQVSHLRVQLVDTECSLVVDTAVKPEQQRVLEREFSILRELRDRLGLPCLPRPYLLGEVVPEAGPAPAQPLKLFIAEWFEGWHEFHLSRPPGSAEPVIRVWDATPEGTFLDAAQSGELYCRAAHILTACLDERTFRQIYPWHHAAGDFIVNMEGNSPDLRLVTARDYRCLANPEPGPGSEWIPLVHFFLNLTLRLRLDRLDGTGDLAWAGGASVSAIVRGFFQAWGEKTIQAAGIPSAGEVLEVLRSFDRDDWLALAEPVMEDGLMESGEYHFLSERIEDHIDRLMEALAEEPA